MRIEGVTCFLLVSKDDRTHLFILIYAFPHRNDG